MSRDYRGTSRLCNDNTNDPRRTTAGDRHGNEMPLQTPDFLQPGPRILTNDSDGFRAISK